MIVIFHRLFQKDLNAALRYYDEEGGKNWEIGSSTKPKPLWIELLPTPRDFILMPKELRRASLRNFSYHILFEENAQRVRILILRHDKRHPCFGMRRGSTPRPEPGDVRRYTLPSDGCFEMLQYSSEPYSFAIRPRSCEARLQVRLS